MQAVPTLDRVDLSDSAGFWTRPLDERGHAFAALRAQPGPAFPP